MPRQTALGLLLVAAAAFFVLSDFRGSRPAVPSTPPAGPDLVAPFATSDDRAAARADAAAFGTLCEQLAECLEYDGGLDQPRIKTGVAIDDLRRAAREMRFGGRSLAITYPRLKDVLSEFFAREVGTSGGPLTPEQRTKWIAAFRTLARCAEYAAAQG